MTTSECQPSADFCDSVNDCSLGEDESACDSGTNTCQNGGTRINADPNYCECGSSGAYTGDFCELGN